MYRADPRGDGGAQSCPACGVALAKSSGTGQRDCASCPLCRGVFGDEDAIGELFGAPADAWRATLFSVPGERRSCMRCGSREAFCLATTRTGDGVVTCCPLCRGVWIEGGSLAHVRERVRQASASLPCAPPGRLEHALARGKNGLLRDPEAARAKGPERPIDFADAEARRRRRERFDFDSPAAMRWALPAAIAFGYVASSGLLAHLLHLFATSWLHELGHASVAWLSGRPSMPGFLLTLWFERSTGLAVLLSTVLGAVTLAGWTAPLWRNRLGKSAWAAFALIGDRLLPRRHFTLGLTTVVFALQLYLSWWTSGTEFGQWGAFGGCAGELVLAGLLVASFFHEMHDRLRWDFWRFPVLFLSTASFMGSTRLWVSVRENASRLPVGSAIGGASDSNGDMNRLMREFGWTAETLARAYLSIAAAMGLLIFVNYVVALLRVRAARDADAPS